MVGENDFLQDTEGRKKLDELKNALAARLCNKIRNSVKINVFAVKPEIYHGQKNGGSLTSVTLRKPEKSATTFPWVSMTPFGFPV